MDADAMDPVLRELLLGTACAASPLRLLRGQGDVLRSIWTRVVEEYWSVNIEVRAGNPRSSLDYLRVLPHFSRALVDMPSWFSLSHWRLKPLDEDEPERPAQPEFLAVAFPEFSGVNVNMMPIDLSKRREAGHLPDEVLPYLPMLERCCCLWRTRRATENEARLAYLTIHESDVAEGASQRRPGLHVESPGIARGAAAAVLAPGAHHHWGRGIVLREGRIKDGIFMASSVADTTRLWNCRIRDERGDIVGPAGDIERLRPLLEGVASATLQANELAWMSDLTPHESLPMPRGGRRQYFRLVAGEVSAWYRDHSTPNPSFDLAAVPGAPPVVLGNKFENGGAYSWAQRRDLDDERAIMDFRHTMTRCGLEHQLSGWAEQFGVRRAADLEDAEVRDNVAHGLDHYDRARFRRALVHHLEVRTSPDDDDDDGSS